MKWLVVGLGNIGWEYALTRHNLGFTVLDAWAQASDTVFSSSRYGSVAEVSYKGRHLTLLKPSTYMNLSGQAVRYWLQALDLGTDRLIVICDDINLPFGSIRLRKRGSDGGHNGLENIIYLLESDQWCRIRVGIGRDFSLGGQIDYVLGQWSDEEQKQLPAICEKVIEGCKSIVTIGPDRTMNFLNVKA